MNALIITNNPRVFIEYSNKEQVEFVEDAGQMEILERARDRIHLGDKLIMHPMAGRIKPHETPYKSVLLEVGVKGETTDLRSVQIIEDSMAETRKFLEGGISRKYSEAMLPDLQWIDLLLLRNGIEEYRR